MRNSFFAPWPSFTKEEADAVSRVLMSNQVNYWTGQECRQFEREFAQWCGADHAVAVANGTVALDLALAALGIGARNAGEIDDEVIVTPRTFLASVSTVVNAGAVPVFVDVDRDSGNITADTIFAAITPRTKAVIVVHLVGWPCDMDPIMKLADKYGLKVIEDCAQAHGAHYRGRSVGSIGHIGTWSFCQDKIMTTGGEGGMLTTSDRELWSSVWSIKDHGKCWEAVYELQHPPGFKWLHERFGTNARMTEIQAAIGRIQLRRMSKWSELRRRNASIIAEALGPFSGEEGAVRVPRFQDIASSRVTAYDSAHAYYKFYAYTRPENLRSDWNRDRIIQEIADRGVPCFQGICSEVYLEKAFDGTGWRPKTRLPVAKELGETSLMFLVHPTLTETEMAKTANVISEVLSRASTS